MLAEVVEGVVLELLSAVDPDELILGPWPSFTWEMQFDSAELEGILKALEAPLASVCADLIRLREEVL